MPSDQDQEMPTKDELRADTTIRLLDRKKPAPTACCPSCRTPLVCTLAFRGAEFYCLECGAAYGWLSPTAVETTPELNEKLAEIEREWEELGGPKLIGGGMMLKACERCSSHDEPHLSHATEEEKAEHAAVLKVLEARAHSTGGTA